MTKEEVVEEDITRKDAAKKLRALANKLSIKAGDDLDNIVLNMRKYCHCVAGFMGDGGYYGGRQEISKIIGDICEIELALHGYGIINEDQCIDGMVGCRNTFYDPDNEMDNLTEIPLSKVILALQRYATQLETKNE